MSEITDIIKDFKISKRINEGATSFEISFATPLAPDEFETGESFEFYIFDNTLDEEHTAVTGMVENIKRNSKDNNRIYGITGRDKGRLLVKQPFDFPCTDVTTIKYTVEQLLARILVNTGITVGRGQTPLSEKVFLNTYESSRNRYCGTFNTKQEAINQLFSQYSKIAGTNRFRWFVDYAGFLRWFEVESGRGNITYIFNDDDRVISFDVEEDATAIINQISGSYGSGTQEDTDMGSAIPDCENSYRNNYSDSTLLAMLDNWRSGINEAQMHCIRQELKRRGKLPAGYVPTVNPYPSNDQFWKTETRFGGSVLMGGDISNVGKDPTGKGTDTMGNLTMYNQESIARFGLCIGDDINEPEYTRSELGRALQRELSMKAFPIYTVKLELSGLYAYEPGTQMMFPNDEYYSTKIFTVVDYEISGSIAQPRTTLNLTTDESAISVNNEFDVVQSAARKEVNEAKARVGVVIGVPDEEGDRCLVWVQTKEGGTVINARNPGGQWDL